MSWWNSILPKMQDNKSAMMMAGLGLLSGQTPQQGFANIAQAMPVGMKMDQNRRQQAQQQAQRNKTLEWARTNMPQHAGAIDAGVLTPADAYRMANKKPDPRQMYKAADGYNYWADNPTERVNPNVQVPKPPRYQTVTGEEATRMGLDGSKAYNIGPQGKVSQIGGNGTTIYNNTGDSVDAAMAKEFSKGIGANFNQIADAGISATRNQIMLKQLDAHLSRFESGGAAALKQMAGNVGVKTEGLDDIQAATALINKMVPEQRVPGSGPMSDADLELFKQSLPRIINQPGGNARIVEYLRGINQYQVQQAEIANMVRFRKISPQQGYEMLYALENPLADFQQGLKSGGANYRADMYLQLGLEPPAEGE